MSIEKRVWSGRARGTVAAVEQIAGGLANAIADVFRRMAEGDPAAGLPLEVDLYSRIGNADGTGSPIALRITCTVEEISLDELAEIEARHD